MSLERNGITDEILGKKWSVTLNAMTNTGVTFLAIVAGIRADSEGEARIKAMHRAIEKGLNIVLMEGAPPIPVRVVFVLPIDAAEDDSIQVTSQMPKEAKQS